MYIKYRVLSSTETMIRPDNDEKRGAHEVFHDKRLVSTKVKFDDVYTGFQKFAEVVGPQGLR